MMWAALLISIVVVVQATLWYIEINRKIVRDQMVVEIIDHLERQVTR